MSPAPPRRSGQRGNTSSSGRSRTTQNPAARRAGASAARTDRRQNPGGGGRGRAESTERAGRGQTPSTRHGLGGEQVEGRRAVRELLAAGRRPVHEVWMAEDLEPSPLLDEIERLATRRHARLQVVSRRRLDAESRTDAPQGVMARAAALAETDLDDLCVTRHAVAPFLVVFDGVTDPHNLGSLLRSAECAGVTGVVVPRHRAAHVTPTVTKVAAGAVEHLAMAVVPGVPNALLRMAAAGVATVGLDADAAVSLFSFARTAGGFDGPVALVIGAEGKGLAALTRRRCEVLVSIPQHGTIESLNVAAAGAVAFFELARARDEAAAGAARAQTDRATTRDL